MVGEEYEFSLSLFGLLLLMVGVGGVSCWVVVVACWLLVAVVEWCECANCGFQGTIGCRNLLTFVTSLVCPLFHRASLINHVKHMRPVHFWPCVKATGSLEAIEHQA